MGNTSELVPLGDKWQNGVMLYKAPMKYDKRNSYRGFSIRS
jgi:hypothetical protein